MTTLDEMWQRLTEHQPYADKYGYGPEWMIMCKTRKRRAAGAVSRVAFAATLVDTFWVRIAVNGVYGNHYTKVIVNNINNAEKKYDRG